MTNAIRRATTIITSPMTQSGRLRIVPAWNGDEQMTLLVNSE